MNNANPISATMKTNIGTGNVTYMTFESFDNTKAVKHAFSTRIGGVSEGIYESLNLRLNHNDDRENVIQNYKLLAEEIDVKLDDMVLAWQVHDVKIYDVTAKDRGKGIMRKSDIVDIDALATNDKDVVLVTFFADCVPLYYLDPVKKVIALAHAGWRGTVARMAEITVKHLQNKYDCKTEDILLGIAPCIGLCCFEVGIEVAEEFYKAFDYVDSFIKQTQAGKYFIDLKGINREINIRAGILPENISVSTDCTKCNESKFFSHRVMGNERGTMAAFMQLK